MDSFEWNKIAGAALFALLVAFGLRIFSEILFETETPESPGYVIAVAEEGAESGDEPVASQPIGVLLASADPAAGENSAKKCGACHTFGNGEANKVGPNLWDIVARPIAGHEGYEYSDAMQAFAAEAGTWDYEHLSTYLLAPQGVVPGTKMAFAGLKNDPERANVIAYLRTLSDGPQPLPPAEAAAEPAEGAAAEGEAPAADDAAPAEGEAAETPAEGEAAPPADDEAPAEGEVALPADAPAEGEAPATDAAAPAEGEAPPAAEPPTEGEAPATEAPAEAEPAAPVDQQGAAPAGDAGGAASAFAAQIAAADVAKGETFAKRCIACHTFEEGGANKVGPHLFDVVNRPVASVPDYPYSDPMTAFSEGGAKVWDYDHLNVYLEDPRGIVPGTKMVFPGIKSEDDRANVVAYLRTLSAAPAALPGE